MMLFQHNKSIFITAIQTTGKQSIVKIHWNAKCSMRFYDKQIIENRKQTGMLSERDV